MKLIKKKKKLQVGGITLDERVSYSMTDIEARGLEVVQL